MSKRYKPLSQQILVITGATSGIGLTTARLAARRGARLVLSARNREALDELAEEIRGQGGDAIYVVADVGERQQVERIAAMAIEHYGGFDTWINNAGVAAYARVMDVAIEDAERLFATNFWGLLYGSRVAVEHLQKRGGGVLINIGSAVAERIIPLQGIYNASKAAVQGLTNTLRLELEERGSPVAVTLINPAAIDTPVTKNAKNYLEVEPRLPPPLYSPDVVAEAVLHCCEHPKRELLVGAAGSLTGVMETVLPTVVDRLMEWLVFRTIKTDQPANHPEGLHTTASRLEERGGQSRFVLRRSYATQARLHPLISGIAMVTLGASLAALAANRTNEGGNGRGWW